MERGDLQKKKTLLFRTGYTLKYSFIIQYFV